MVVVVVVSGTVVVVVVSGGSVVVVVGGSVVGGGADVVGGSVVSGGEVVGGVVSGGGDTISTLGAKVVVVLGVVGTVITPGVAIMGVCPAAVSWPTLVLACVAAEAAWDFRSLFSFSKPTKSFWS